jgi:hypothetical protein
VPFVVTDPILESGPLGVEGRHQWNGGLMINDLSADPRLKITGTIGGLYSLPDAEDLRDNPIGRRGEIPRNSVRRGKTLTYPIAVQAHSMADMRSLMGQAASSFQNLAEGLMVITPDPAYADGTIRSYRARALACESGDEQFDNQNLWPYQQPFLLSLRMSDPRFYDPATVTGDTGAIASGHSDVVVHSTGRTDSDPVIDIYGPVTNPTISNQTTGHSLIFDADGGIAIASGHYLRVDFFSRRVLLDNTTNRYSKLDKVASDWWDAGVEGIVPGDNAIRLAGSSFSSPAKAHVAFNPAFLA